MSNFTFLPRAPKPAQEIKLAALKASVAANEYRIEGVKEISRCVVKVFTDGAENFYMKDSASLRNFLATYFRAH